MAVVSSSCASGNTTTEINWTSECTTSGRRGDGDEAPAIDGVTWTLVVADGAIMSVGLVGNILVIYVMARYARMKTVTNVYILNQSINQFLWRLGVLGYEKKKKKNKKSLLSSKKFTSSICPSPTRCSSSECR